MMTLRSGISPSAASAKMLSSVVGFAVALTEEQRLLYARQRMQFIKPEHAYAQG